MGGHVNLINGDISTPFGTEVLPLAEACGRILAETVVAPFDLPPYNRAALDGYAVRSADVARATPREPVELSLVGRLRPGQRFTDVVGSGEAVAVVTGSPLPPGTDAVVRIEDAMEIGQRVRCFSEVRPWENVDRAGEDLRAGERVAAAGERICLGHLAVLAALGRATVTVLRRPRVGIAVQSAEATEDVYARALVGYAEACVLEAGGLPVKGSDGKPEHGGGRGQVPDVVLVFRPRGHVREDRPCARSESRGYAGGQAGGVPVVEVRLARETMLETVARAVQHVVEQLYKRAGQQVAGLSSSND